MIANKVLPTFYVLDLEGDAASLEFMLGTKHNVRRVTVHSCDFEGDVLAVAAGKQAFDFFTYSFKDDGKETNEFNPEFFLTQAPIEPSLEMLHAEELASETEEKIEKNGDIQTVVLTRRFDDWGDFVVARSTIEGSTFNGLMKVAVNPRRYLLEKNLEKQEYVARLHGLKSEPGTALVH